MADIDKKIVQLDEKINKLTKRIRKDTEECEKLSEQKALLIYQSLCKKYSCEGQSLADMIAREHEQLEMLSEGITDSSSLDSSGDVDADDEEMFEQTSFSEKKNPYAV
ncbi:MAG: hypothetical protein IK999_09075 [Ruminococcus sp.]|nr:hypothetical protein [Ruminococcus sp.]